MQESVYLTNLQKSVIYLDTANAIIKSKGGTAQHLPDLIHFYPTTIDDIEIQQFNLSTKLPSKLQNTEDVATFLIDNYLLNRQSVARFLLVDEEVNSQSLHALANRVCSVDIVNTYVSGLKLFLPTTGIIDCNDNSDNMSSDRKMMNMEYVITAYSKAYIASSKALFVSNKLIHLPVVVSIGMIICTLSRNLLSTAKQSNLIMSQFFESARDVMLKYQMKPMSMRELTDIYNDVINGRPIAPLDVSDMNTKSYLFATRSIKQGWISVGYNSDGIERSKFYAKLEFNGLYLFHQDPMLEECYPVSCFPLNNVQVLSGDGHDNLLIELWPIDDAALAVISMSRESSGDFTPSLPVVRSIDYYPCVAIDVCPDSSHSVNQVVLDEWVDALEATCWTCRRCYDHTQ